MSKHAWWVGAVIAAAAIFAAPAAADEGGEADAPRRISRESEGARGGEADAPRRISRESEGARGGEADAPARISREGEGARSGKADKRAAEGAPAPQMPRDLAAMAQKLDLTDQQKQDLKDKLAEKDAALAKWKADNDDRIRQAQDAIRKAQADLAAIMDEQKKLAEAKEADVMAVFTPKQLAMWEVMKVLAMYETGGGEGQALILTDNQKIKMKELADDAAAELVAAQPADAKAKQEILRKLQTNIYDNVLEPEQRPLAPKPASVRRGGEE